MMAKVAKGILMLFSFAVPWEYSLDLGEPFGNVARILGLLLFLTAIPSVLSSKGVRRPGALQWLVLGLYLYFACTYFWTIDADATLDKMRAYFQVIMVVWLVWEFCSGPDDLRDLMRTFVAGCWVLAILTFLNFLSLGSADLEAVAQIRFAAEGQDPNDVARFLDLGFPLATLLFATERQWPLRLLAIGYLPVGLLAVLLTASRGGFSAGIVALVGSALVLLAWRPRAGVMALAGLAVAAGAVFLFVPTESLDRLATIPEQLGSSDWNDRLNIWTAGWQAFRLAPWLGYGAGTYSAAAGLAQGDTAHNTVMAVLVTGGLLGLADLVGIIAMVAWAVVHTRGLLRLALGTALVVWIITSMVGSVEENRVTWLLFAMMALAGRFAMEQSSSLVLCFSSGKAIRLTEVPQRLQ